MAFTHRKTDTSKNKASKSKASKDKASKSRKNKTEYIKGTLDGKGFANLTGTVTVQLAEDTNPKSKRVAWGSLIIGGCFVIYVSVYEGKNGYFISYPSYKDSDDEYHDLAYCMDSKVIEGLKDLITEMIGGDDEDNEDDEDDDGDLPF